MVIGKNHKEHDLALTSLLETARKCNVWLNYDKLQYKKTEVDFFRETYTTDGHKPAQTNSIHAITTDTRAELQKGGTIIYRHD